MPTAAHPSGLVIQDEQQELRRFWERVVFALGMGAGLFPFAVPPLALSAAGRHTAGLEFIALVVFSLTVLPACVTAFWCRGVAAVWLLAAGVVIAAMLLAEQHALLAAHHMPPDYGSDYLFVFPLALGAFGIFTEWKRWPLLLDKPLKKGK